MDGHRTEDWVKEQLAKLNPAPDWLPDEERALARLNEHLSLRRRPGRHWMWSAISAAVACVCLLVFPGLWGGVKQIWTRHNDSQVVYVGQVYAALATKNRQAAPNFVLRNVQGDDIHLSDYRGHVVLLNFWASWCPPCKAEIPWLSDFEKSYKDQGLEVIGVAIQDGPLASLRDFASDLGINYQVLLDDGETAESYRISAVPMTYIIDRDGNIAAASSGIINRAECVAEIVRLLKQSQ